jgi:hypothetical protein
LYPNPRSCAKEYVGNLSYRQVSIAQSITLSPFPPSKNWKKIIYVTRENTNLWQKRNIKRNAH